MVLKIHSYFYIVKNLSILNKFEENLWKSDNYSIGKLWKLLLGTRGHSIKIYPRALFRTKFLWFFKTQNVRKLRISRPFPLPPQTAQIWILVKTFMYILRRVIARRLKSNHWLVSRSWDSPALQFISILVQIRVQYI